MKTLLVLTASFLIGCASTQYSQYEGGGIIEGTGGTKTVVDGIEIWENGTPPKKYQVIGIVDTQDQRDKEDLLADVAKKTKEVGGDAAIISEVGSQAAGAIPIGGLYAVAYKQSAKAQVIKYR